MAWRPPTPTLFPYTTLFRSERLDRLVGRRGVLVEDLDVGVAARAHRVGDPGDEVLERDRDQAEAAQRGGRGEQVPDRDRKSTRLNSSHGYISYAGLCLKKNS